MTHALALEDTVVAWGVALVTISLVVGVLGLIDYIERRQDEAMKTPIPASHEEMRTLLTALIVGAETEREQWGEGQERTNLARMAAQTRFMRTALVNGQATWHEAHQWYTNAVELLRIMEARRNAAMLRGEN